ncbi:MAG: EamA family transporter [Deltaproteobacteria bacterium]|nr:EamA family transporter [Deltaproteobacteria bacterium]
MLSGPTKGYLCVIAAAVMWASSGTAGKALFQIGVDPFEMVQIRVTLSALILLALFGFFQKQRLRIRTKEIVYFLVLGMVTSGLHLSYFYAISKIQVAAAILLEYLAPILVVFYSICFWKERISTIKILALLLSILGCYLVVGGYNLGLEQTNRIGILWGLSAAASFAAYTLLGERGMHRYSPWTVLFYALLCAALWLNVLYKPFNYIHVRYSPLDWAGFLYIAIFGTILPFGLYFVGVNHIRSTRTAITATLEPISAAFMAFFLLDEVLRLPQILGGFAVIAAIVLLQWQREQDELTPDKIRKHNNSI